jgi:hypothetical protein
MSSEDTLVSIRSFYNDRGGIQSGEMGMDFISVIEGATNEVDWTTRLTLVTEGVGLRVQDGGYWPYVLLGLEMQHD